MVGIEPNVLKRSSCEDPLFAFALQLVEGDAMIAVDFSPGPRAASCTKVRVVASSP
jgi:hypothetical protein